MSMVHGVDGDPHVLAGLHMSAGFGSSQTYLLFALADVLPNIMAAVTSATLHERGCILMFNTSQELWTAPFQLKVSCWTELFLLISARPNDDVVELLLGTGTVPIDDVDQLPGIFAELELKLTLFVDDQLGGRIENAGALALVGIV